MFASGSQKANATCDNCVANSDIMTQPLSREPAALIKKEDILKVCGT